MGDNYWGVHLPFAALIRLHGIRQAVETGTYYGQGATQLAALYERVWTIERSQTLHQFCRSVLGPSLPNVEFELGDSVSVLKTIAPLISEPTLFVLDAHWFPDDAIRRDVGPQCPLLDELAAIRTTADVGNSVIMIDDADMLLRSLPEPFASADFPSIFEVARVLCDDLKMAHVDVQDDVLVAGPIWTRQILSDYVSLKQIVGAPAGKRVIP